MVNPNQNQSSDEGQGAFNMAISTLMRIDNILTLITNLTYAPYLKGTIQSMKIELVKNFWINSAPLLKKEVHENYKWIFDLKPSIAIITDTMGNEVRREAGFMEDIEIKLNKFVLDVEMELQKEGDYLMAGKKDLRFSWKAD